METGAQAWEAQLAQELRPLGVESFGVVWDAPRAWDEGTRRVVPRPGAAPLTLAHDEREAPYALRADGCEDCGLLVSLTDEVSLAACAWARLAGGSSVLGLGIDLADPQDFAGERGERFNHLLFTEGEQRLVSQLWPGDEPLGYAYAFSAKEAAFKACAAPLRRWYESHAEELVFDLRGFELVDERHEAGTAPRGNADYALPKLEIGRLELARHTVAGYACTVCVALP